MNQKGIAYLLVLILGGIIVTASMVYYSSTVIESRVSTNSRLAKEVFYHAEHSINNATSEIFKGGVINPDTPPATFTLNFTQVKTNYQLHSNVTFDQYGNEIFTEGTEVIKVEVIDLSRIKRTYQDDKIITYNVTAKGNLIKNQRNLLPRNVGGVYKLYISRFRYITTVYNEITVSNSTNPNWPGFEYGINSGGTLEFSGSTVVRNGGVYANQTLNLGNAKNQLRIDKGEAYSSGTITGVGKINPVGNNPALNPNYPPITYPTINLPYYASIADYTITGNTTFNSFSSLPTIDPATQPPNDVIVVYVDGDLKITGNFINTQPILLVVKGKVDMNGNATIGSPDIPFGIIAGGDINRSTGNADVNGFYYTPEKIDMKGNFNLRGAIVGVKGVTLTGNVDINYSKSLAEGLPLILDPDSSPDVTQITVTVLPGTIINGNSSTLSWTTTNVTSLTISPSISTNSLPTGSAAVSPTTTTTYLFTATGSGGTVTVSVIITVVNSANDLPEPDQNPTTTFGNWTIDSLSSTFIKGTWWQKIDTNVP